MEYAIGLIVAVGVILLAAGVGLGRDRAFYPTVLIVVGSYYVLFAAMGASGRTLAVECVFATVFLLFAVFGFKKNLWLAAAGLVGHGIFDFFHHYFIDNPGMPRWWPGFCMACDVVLGVFLAVWLVRHPRLSEPQP